MSTIQIRDIAYARFGAPDLEKAERFLTDFGLVVGHRSEDTLYARGTDPTPFVYVAELGEPGFRGLAFEASAADDLERLAAEEGVAVESLDGPSGGRRVRLRDPDGYAIDVVHGRERLDPLPVRSAAPLNRGSDRARLGALQRVAAGPSSVKRLGHAVLFVSDFAASSVWYRSRLGMLPSDEVYLGDEANVIAAFMRCDQGARHVDHHTLALFQRPDGVLGVDHVAFEVEDFDAVMAGHDHLEQAGYEHKVGIGRHILGSQVYDYWRDPWGNVLEHFTDGDLIDASAPAGRHDPSVALGTQWGVMAV